jgi:hypothetical protein
MDLGASCDEGRGGFAADEASGRGAQEIGPAVRLSLRAGACRSSLQRYIICARCKLWKNNAGL